MSYSILYRTAFLKMEDGTFIPVGETGDNNVWEADNRRRSRHWSNGWGMFSRKLSYTEQEIEDTVKTSIEETVARYAGKKVDWEDHVYTRDEVLRNLGYFESLSLYGKGANSLSAAQFLGWFRRGIRNACTFAELNDMYVRVIVYAYTSGDFRKIPVKTDAELLQALAQLKAEGLDPCVGYEYLGDFTYKCICERNRKASEPRERKPLTKAYVVRLVSGLHSGKYVREKTSRRFILSDREYAHKYPSAAATKRVCKALERNGLGYRVDEIDLTAA